MRPHHATADDQRHSRHRHHTIVEKRIVFQSGDGHSEKRARAQEFAHEAYNDQNPGITQSIADAIEERLPRSVHHGERFETSHENTVRNNQSHVDRKLNTHIICVGFEDLTHHCDERRHDDKLNNDANTRRNGVSDQRNDHIGKSRDHRDRKSHHDSRFQLRSHSQGRTDAEHLPHNGVVEVQGAGENLLVSF